MVTAKKLTEISDVRRCLARGPVGHSERMQVAATDAGEEFLKFLRDLATKHQSVAKSEKSVVTLRNELASRRQALQDARDAVEDCEGRIGVAMAILAQERESAVRKDRRR